MRAEIGEPLERERRAEREELPPVEGCGYTDPSFDPMAEWTLRQASKPKAQTVYESIMPGVEAMPNWRQFVGWVEPDKNEDRPELKVAAKPSVRESEAAEKPSASSSPSLKAVEEKNVETLVSSVPSAEMEGATVVDLDLAVTNDKDETSLDLGDLDLTSVANADEVTTATVVDVDLPGPDGTDETGLDLGDLDMASVIAAAVSSVDDVASEPETEPAVAESDQSANQATMMLTLDEPTARLDDFAHDPSQTTNSLSAKDSTMVVTLDEPTASPSLESPAETKVDLVVSAPSVTSASSALRPVPPDVGLSAKLASVRPLAHPGRLPRKFELSEAEKEVLRLCNGHRTTQSILDSGIGLDGSELSEFMRRCAQVKLVTFKR